MARQGTWSRLPNAPLSARTWHPWSLPCRLLSLHISRLSKWSIRAMKYIPTWTNFLFLVGVLAIPYFLQQTPFTANWFSGALSFWSSTSVLSAMKHFQSGLWDVRSLIRVTQRSIRRSHCSGQAPCLLLMLTDWAGSETLSLTSFCFRCIVKPLCYCQISMVSAAHWLTPTVAFSAQMQTSRVGIWIVLPSGTTDFGNKKASHYILGSQWWSKIEWWVSYPGYTKQASGVLNVSSRAMRCGSRGEHGVLKVLEIVSKVGSQGEYISGLGGLLFIRRHHLGCYSARKKFA